MRFNTDLLHAGVIREANGATLPPVYQSSAFEQDTAADLEKIENVLKTYPYMYPFEDDSVDVCVRLEPGDIDKLPVDTWLLANNSFLLNGYYSYRHIILMKMNSDSKPVYLVGVPGIHRQREDFLAGMFGFKMFKPIRDVSTVKGEFGYWCMNICP